jgi:simple sugar transport system permease protein
VPALFACFLFAFTDAAICLQMCYGDALPTQAIQALPYLATVLLLAGFVGRAVAPKAIGQPYVKER